MSEAIAFVVPEDRWDPSRADAMDESHRLLYRSNLLGADLSITNFGGGNTSAKIAAADPLTGARRRVLWVKGSGGDLGSMSLDGFATLDLDRLLTLEERYRGAAHEDEMPGLLPHATFGGNMRPASIDTPLHAYLPFAHVDHMHPDAVIAVAACRDSERLTREIWRGRLGWLPWRRPGFELGLMLRDLVARQPGLDGVVLAGHGLFTWGDTAETCYKTTIATIARAAEYLNERERKRRPFGSIRVPAQPAEARDALAATLMPRLRAALGGGKVGDFVDTPQVLDFVNSEHLRDLAPLGTSCPDHFLRTKIRPLVIDPGATEAEIAHAVARYRDDYAAYWQRCRRPDSPAMRDANPVVLLLPGLGMATFAGDKTTARIASEFYRNAINVMRGAETIDAYVGLPEQEAFDIEYWLLEEAKLRRMPRPKPLAGRIAYVTGAAGGIGSAVAEALLDEGAVVMLADRDAEGLERVGAALAGRFGQDALRRAICDVTDEARVAASFAAVARAFGGLDILVANAGIASSAPLGETTLELWRRNYGVLVEGYFLAARAAFGLMTTRVPGGASGGSIVFVGSKNALAATPNASAYASAKAAELHLARCLALEGAPHGIRVNTVNPDAVLKGSRIWEGEWREERARAHGVSADALDEVYRNRSLLKREVLPEDVAAAVVYFASDRSAKSTGNILNVDAGNAAAFTR